MVLSTLTSILCPWLFTIVQGPTLGPAVREFHWVSGFKDRHWLGNRYKDLLNSLTGRKVSMLRAGIFTPNCLFLGRISVAEDQPKTSLVTSRLSSYWKRDLWSQLKTKMNCVSREPWFAPKPLSTKTLSIKIFLEDVECRVILPTNCIKKPGSWRTVRFTRNSENARSSWSPRIPD